MPDRVRSPHGGNAPSRPSGSMPGPPYYLQYWCPQCEDNPRNIVCDRCARMPRTGLDHCSGCGQHTLCFSCSRHVVNAFSDSVPYSEQSYCLGTEQCWQAFCADVSALAVVPARPLPQTVNGQLTPWQRQVDRAIAAWRHFLFNRWARFDPHIVVHSSSAITCTPRSFTKRLRSTLPPCRCTGILSRGRRDLLKMSLRAKTALLKMSLRTKT